MGCKELIVPYVSYSLYTLWWHDGREHVVINDRSKSHTPIMARILIHWGRVTHLCVSKLCHMVGDNQLSEPLMVYCQFDYKEHSSVSFFFNSKVFIIQWSAFENVVFKNGGHLVSSSMCQSFNWQSRMNTELKFHHRCACRCHYKWRYKVIT